MPGGPAENFSYFAERNLMLDESPPQRNEKFPFAERINEIFSETPPPRYSIVLGR